MTTIDSRDITVIGAGVVGVCCGLQLQRDGHRVTLIDYQDPGEGCSRGNAGLIIPQYCVPGALPGIVRQVPGMLVDPLGTLTIRWRYLPQIAPWLLRFMAAGSVARVEDISVALFDLNRDAVEAFRPLVSAAGAEHLLRYDGLLDLYEKESSFEKDTFKIELKRRRRVHMQILNTEEVRELEPGLGRPYAAGVLYADSAHTIDPRRLTQLLAERFGADGGRIRREKVLSCKVTGDGGANIRTDTATHAADIVVLAAGAFSKKLAMQLGSKVPLDTERGYHAMLPQPGIELRRPIALREYYFGLTPMADGLRLAGTVELAGLEAPPNYARADKLIRAAKEMFPDLNVEGADRWMGHRPSLPDSLPVLGRSPVHANVYFAFGHGHLGLTGAAVTGKVVADLVAGRRPDFDITPLRAERW